MSLSSYFGLNYPFKKQHSIWSNMYQVVSVFNKGSQVWNKWKTLGCWWDKLLRPLCHVPHSHTFTISVSQDTLFWVLGCINKTSTSSNTATLDQRKHIRDQCVNSKNNLIMSTAASLHFTWRDKMSYSFFTLLRGWKGHMPVKVLVI